MMSADMDLECWTKDVELKLGTSRSLEEKTGSKIWMLDKYDLVVVEVVQSSYQFYPTVLNFDSCLIGLEAAFA